MADPRPTSVTVPTRKPGVATHDCPGGCGRLVRNQFFACPTDWARLPRDRQRPIVRTAYRSLLDPERAAAVTDAVEWYAAQEDNRG